jgi:hypothetical protein
MAQMSAGMIQGFAGVMQELAGVDARFAGVAQGSAGASGGFAGIIQKPAGVTEGFAGVVADFTGMSPDLAGVLADLSGLSADCAGSGEPADGFAVARPFRSGSLFVGVYHIGEGLDVVAVGQAGFFFAEFQARFHFVIPGAAAI